MKKVMLGTLLIVLALLTVVSVVNITGFAVNEFSDKTGASLDTRGAIDSSSIDDKLNNPEGKDSAGTIVIFPNDGGLQDQTGGQLGGSEDPVITNNIQPGAAPEEFHSECSQELCVIVEGPGEDTCSDSSDCIIEPVCGDGICEAGKEDEVTCLADCQVNSGEEGEEEPLLKNTNPATGQGDLSDEDYQSYVATSFATCTNNFGLCVRVPKITGNEEDICGPNIATCAEIQAAIEERASEQVQLAPISEGFVLKFLRLFFGR